MSRLEKLKEKARTLEGKDPKGAIEAWLDVLKGQEEEGDPNPDLSVFNRIGDLYLKVKDPALAADYYDRAVDKYAELGFHNNAIAMCNKVLRNAPGRQTTYLKLAKLYASKGFMAEAKQNFVEYAERMHKAGKIQHAFAALKEFADISAESAHLRQTLEEHLRMYGDPERRPGAGTAAPAAPKPQPPDDPSKSGRRKTSSLVFLDVDAPPAGKPPVPGRVPPPPKLPPKPALEPEPVVESLIEPVIAEPDTSLEIETTSLVDGLDPSTAGGMLEGFETTSAEFGEIQLDAQPAPVLQDEVSPDDIPPPAEFEPTVAEEESAPDAAIELEPLLETEIEIEAPVAKAPPGGGAGRAEAARRRGAAAIWRGESEGARVAQDQTGRSEAPGPAGPQAHGGSAAARARAGLRHRRDRRGARGRRSATGNRRCGRRAGRRRPPLRGDRPEPGRRRDAGGRTRIARVRQHRCAPGETDDRGPRGAGRR